MNHPVDKLVGYYCDLLLNPSVKKDTRANFRKCLAIVLLAREIEFEETK